MQNLRFEAPSPAHQARYERMMDEWEAFGGKIFPGGLRRIGQAPGERLSYAEWLARTEAGRDAATCPPGRLPQHLLLAFDESGEMIGAVCIRPALNEETRKFAGHIGYGVRPSARGRGYATRMLSMALSVLGGFGVPEAILTCNSDNPASARVILKNGGVFENELAEPNGNRVKRFRIVLNRLADPAFPSFLP